MASDGRLTPYNDSLTFTSRHSNFDLTSSPSRPHGEATCSDEAKISFTDSMTNDSKRRRGDSPPPLPHYLPSPHSKRRPSRTPPRDHSKRLVGFNELYPSRSRSPVSSTPTIKSYRPRCRGCRSKKHVTSACAQICVNCRHIGHNVALCSQFAIGRDGRSWPLKSSRGQAIERQRGLHEARIDWDRPQNSPDVRSDSLQYHSIQPTTPSRSPSLESTNPPPKSSQRLAFEEEESIKQARHEADMARRAAAQKLELEHQVRLLEIRQQYAAGLLSSNAMPSSVLYPPYDPNGPLEMPDMVSTGESLPVHAAAAIGEQRGGNVNGGIKREKGIKYEVVD